MNCKKCDQEDIDAEAYNALGGGFLCRQCYRQLQWMCAGIGLAIATVGIVPIVLFFIMAGKLRA